MSEPSRPKQRFLLVLALAMLLVATRFHNLAPGASFPDATLAVFFLGGFYLRSVVFIPFFFAVATFIDYVAIKHGVSAWCVTPAYLFLLPTYASLSVAGRWYARRHRHAWRTLLPLVSALFVGTTLAFLMSNGSFYLFSGYFDGISLSDYSLSVAKYFAPYLLDVLVYVSVAACVHVLLTVADSMFRKAESAAAQGG